MVFSFDAARPLHDGITGSDGLTPDPNGAPSPVSREYAARVYVSCAAGYKTVVETNGTSTCVPCEPGTYGVVAGASSCAACPLGRV